MRGHPHPLDQIRCGCSNFLQALFDLRQSKMTPREWGRQNAEYKAALKKLTPSLARRDAVRNFVADACLRGKLGTGMRSIAGGAIEAIDSALWSTERWRPRFVQYQLNLAEPFGLASFGLGPTWRYIFVVDRDLRLLLNEPEIDEDSLPRRFPTAHQKSKPGPRSMAPRDESSLQEMRQLMDSEKATSVEEAARMVAEHAAGHGTPASKQHRLAKRFRKTNR